MRRGRAVREVDPRFYYGSRTSTGGTGIEWRLTYASKRLRLADRTSLTGVRKEFFVKVNNSDLRSHTVISVAQGRRVGGKSGSSRAGPASS